MLLLSSRILEHGASDVERIGLLEKLRERNFIPLIRSMRLRFYGMLTEDQNLAREMEQTVAESFGTAWVGEYVRGDLFFFDDHVLFLLFEDQVGPQSAMRAGIVYEPGTTEPLRKLNSFCQTISACLEGERPEEGAGVALTELSAWRQDPSSFHPGFARFVARQDADSLSAIACRENARERVRAARVLEDDYARLFLRRTSEAYSEGYALNSSADEAITPSELTMSKLLEADLLRRELLVSCRKTGHHLFNLPSADALAVITISQATCSVCGASIADEKIEEVLSPTRLSSALLDDAAWLVNRLHTIFRELGIPESEIAIEPPAGDGEARLLARVCGELFLVAMRDGDLTPRFARRAVNAKTETDARHLVIVMTGAVHNEARMNLMRFAKQVERGGSDFEMIIAEGVQAAEAELRRAFEGVSRRALTEQLCELDTSLGVSAACLVRTRFEMLRNTEVGVHLRQLPPATENNQPTRLLT
ncbi:MAG: hypothetical protein M3362_14920 [Acidobacteriota bacterium]|nr:hypothetical protein [Acidobacteriota bacterium]